MYLFHSVTIVKGFINLSIMLCFISDNNRKKFIKGEKEELLWKKELPVSTEVSIWKLH